MGDAVCDYLGVIDQRTRDWSRLELSYGATRAELSSDYWPPDHINRFELAVRRNDFMYVSCRPDIILALS